MSAVSNSVQPISSAASTPLRAPARSAPATRHIPHPMGATSRPLLPSGMRVPSEGPRPMQLNSNPMRRRSSSGAIEQHQLDEGAARGGLGAGGAANQRVGGGKDRHQGGVL